jgi:hypothetical protein
MLVLDSCCTLERDKTRREREVRTLGGATDVNLSKSIKQDLTLTQKKRSALHSSEEIPHRDVHQTQMQEVGRASLQARQPGPFFELVLRVRGVPDFQSRAILAGNFQGSAALLANETSWRDLQWSQVESKSKRP